MPAATQVATEAGRRGPGRSLAGVAEGTRLVGSRQLSVAYAPSAVTAGQVLAAVAAADLGVVDVTTQEADLEDIFLRLTQTGKQQEAAE